MKLPPVTLRVLSCCLTGFILTAAVIPPAPAQDLARRARFETILKHYTCGHGERANYVITDKDQWERVWSQAMSNVWPIPPAPEIDFSQQSVIAVFEGDEPSTDYTISVKKLIRSGKNLGVVVEEKIPADACRVLMVVTQPVHIIVTERVLDPSRVSFKMKQRIRDCSGTASGSERTPYRDLWPRVSARYRSRCMVSGARYRSRYITRGT